MWSGFAGLCRNCNEAKSVNAGILADDRIIRPPAKLILEFPMKRRILLVDDELAILLTLRAILEMNGFEVDTAASAKEAQHKLKNGVYEMVITDMRMESETAGYDVIRAARQQPYDPGDRDLTAYPSLGNEWKSKGAHRCW